MKALQNSQYLIMYSIKQNRSWTVDLSLNWTTVYTTMVALFFPVKDIAKQQTPFVESAALPRNQKVK